MSDVKENNVTEVAEALIPGRSRRSRFTPMLAGLVALALIGLALALTPILGWFAGETEAASTELDATQTGLVAVVDLAATSEVDATLTAVNTTPVTAQSLGTITAVADVGQHLNPGAIIYAVDEQPIVYLPGSVPAWRPITVDSVGPDVEQLEAALVTLGYDTAGDLSVDGTFTSYTAELVSRWQEDLGLDATGTVEFGSVVFAPPDETGGVTVAVVEAAVGDQATASTVAVLSDGRRHVEFVAEHGEVEYTDLRALDVGATIEVRLPDRSTAPATVDQRYGLGDGQWLVTASFGADVADLPRSLTDVPVTVSWSTTLSEQALTVPAAALIRHDDGTYVVTVMDGDVERAVEVTPTAAAARVVEVAGDLHDGDVVVVP